MKKNHPGIEYCFEANSGDGLRGMSGSGSPWLANPCVDARKCGHIGCWRRFSKHHATKHYAINVDILVVASFEPGEDWFIPTTEKQRMIKGVCSWLPPHSHPATQPAPRPSGNESHRIGERSPALALRKFRT